MAAGVLKIKSFVKGQESNGFGACEERYVMQRVQLNKTNETVISIRVSRFML